MGRLDEVLLSSLYSMSSGISSEKQQAGHGSPFLSFSTVFNSYFLPDQLPDLMETSEAEQQTYSIKAGDVFLTRTSETIDELGMSSVALQDYPRATYSGFLKRLRPLPNNNLYPKYLAFYLRSYLFRKAMTNNASMTLRASLNEDIFSWLKLYLPSYDQQVKIGDLLYAVETKCQVNQKLIDELEATTRLIYDYWFTQFDFPDKNGRPYRTNGGKMVWNEDLECKIPEGWSVSPVESVLSKIRRTPRIKSGEYLKVGKVPVIDQGKKFIAGFTNNENAILNDETGYIVFGDHTRRVKYICFPFARGADGTQIIKSNLRELPDELLYEQIKEIDLPNYGYSRHFKFLKKSLIMIPNNNLGLTYQKNVQPIHRQIARLLLQNIKLAELRDWLLPMLISGQVTVGEQE